MSIHSCFRVTVLAAAMALGALSGMAAQAAPTLAGCELFPSSAIFSQRIDDVQRFPPHERSAAWLGSIGLGRKLHADWGRTVDPAQTDRYYGIPVSVVDGTPATTRWPLVSHAIQDARDANGSGVPSESDCAVGDQGLPVIQRGCDGLIPARRRFPYPNDGLLKAERGLCNDPATCGDRHVLVLEQGACRLWESYFTYQINGRWSAYSTAAWDLKSMEMRPDGWTSADAAGLPILPLLARADEVEAGVISHALRVTFRDAVLDRRHTWPASHSAGTTRADGIPFGALLRLRADFDIPFWWTAQAKVLARAMQKYGLYVADIGSDFYVQGDPDERWGRLTIWQIQRMKLNDFEFVDLGAITRHPRFHPRSYQAAW
ncbi:MAG: hypothetical protein KAX42_10760 [Sphaerotilus sp.]|jgi:hypothetical protein|nr:hypothetical protein [Sphaerotilus sp.]